MKVFTVNGGDTIRLTAKDVSHADVGPITTGLTGSVSIVSMLTQQVVGGPVPITLHSGDDWYVDLISPATDGQYRIDMLINYLTASRTLQLKLIVV